MKELLAPAIFFSFSRYRWLQYILVNILVIRFTASPFVAFVAFAACSSGRMRWSNSAAGSLTHRRGAASGLFRAAAVRELPHGTRQHGDMGTPEKKWLIHTNNVDPGLINHGLLIRGVVLQ